MNVRSGPPGGRLPVALLAGFTAAAADAHVVDRAAAPDALAWTFEPWVVACLAVSVGLYAVGLARLWRHAGRGRGVGPGRLAAFCAGTLVLVLALVSPLDALGSRLFSAHMVQHELLMIAAAPLLVAGRPLAVWAWALPLPWRRTAGRLFHAPAWRKPWLFLTGPWVAWLLHALALWLWHLPVLFDAALANEGVHTLQHASFFLTALVFWWSILGGATRRERGIGLLSLFTTMVHTGALGALLTLSHTPWYPAYFSVAARHGLDALQDQQLGGLVMWIPAGLVYIVCGVALAARWLAPAAPARGRLATRG